MLKTYNQVYSEVVATIKARNASISVNPGSVVNDIFVVPTSNQIVNDIIISDYIGRLQSLDQCLSMQADAAYLGLVAGAYNTSTDTITNDISSNIDKIGANFKQVRSQSTFATGVVSYCRSTPLTSSDDDIIIYSGSRVQSTSGETYVVTADAIMLASNGAAYYDAFFGNKWSISVSVMAVDVGTIGNCSVGAITFPVTQIAGIDYIYNKQAITNGLPAETDSQYVARLKLVYTGNNIGSQDGYKKLIVENTDISEVYVSGAQDKFMRRDEGYGGKVDVYVLEKQLTQHTESVAAASQYYAFIKQPVDISSIVVSGHGSAKYVIESSVDPLFSGSIKDKIRIRWINYIDNPPVVPYSVTYNYNSNVETAQALLDKSENRIVFGTEDAVLVKQSEEIPIDISITIAVLPSGYTKATVVQDVKTVITRNINSLTLGDSLQQSDIVAWAYTVPGVDQVHLPLQLFNKSSESSVTPVVDEIFVNGNQYIRAENPIVS